MSNARAEAILNFWFGPNPDDTGIHAGRANMWYCHPMNRPKVDGAIRAKFLADYEQACAGKWECDLSQPRERLALIILLDQFARNLNRPDDSGKAHDAKPDAYKNDEKALALCREAMANGDDKKLRFAERQFLYMPLMHSENPEIMELSKKTFTELAADAKDPMQKGQLEWVLSNIVHNGNMIRQFGRYPHRNKMLGRTSSPEELKFLETEPHLPGTGSQSIGDLPPDVA